MAGGFKRFVNRMLGIDESAAPTADPARTDEQQPGENGFHSAPDQPFSGSALDPTFPSMPAAGPPPGIDAADETEVELERLNAMHERGELDDAEYQRRRNELLAD